MTSKFISIEDRKAWDEALEGLQYSYFHTWDYCHALSKTAIYDTIKLFVAKSFEKKLIVPIVERSYHGHNDIVTAYGFSGFVTNDCWATFREVWLDSARSQGYVTGYIGLHPLARELEYSADAGYSVGRTVYIIDLTQSEKDLYSALQGKGKKADSKLKSNAKLVSDKTLLMERFPALYFETMSRVDANDSYFFSEQTLLLLMASKDVEMIGIEENGEIIAIDIFLRAPLCAEYFLSASKEEGRRHSTSLLWNGMLLLKNLNCGYLNLGGGVVEQDGLDKFKKRFGATARQFFVLKQIYDKNTYQKLCQDAGVSPENSNYFPAFRHPKGNLN